MLIEILNLFDLAEADTIKRSSGFSKNTEIKKIEFCFLRKNHLDRKKYERMESYPENLFGLFISEYPLKKKTCYVEIGIYGQLVWGIDVLPVSSTEAFLKTNIAAGVIIQGLLEFDGNDFFAIKVNQHSIDVEIINAPDNYSGYVRIDTNYLCLYDMGL